MAAINEYQDLGSGMKIAMRDLEISGAGSLMGAEQHNLSGVGFDLFTQMLGEAVAEEPVVKRPMLSNRRLLAIYADFFWMRNISRKLIDVCTVYRRLAAAQDLADVDEYSKETRGRFAVLPLAGKNLFDRAFACAFVPEQLRYHLDFAYRRACISGVKVPREQALTFKARGAISTISSQKSLAIVPSQR